MKSYGLTGSYGIKLDQRSYLTEGKKWLFVVPLLNNHQLLVGFPRFLLYVTEFWKITLMGVHETIRIFEFTTILLTSQNTF